MVSATRRRSSQGRGKKKMGGTNGKRRSIARPVEFIRAAERNKCCRPSQTLRRAAAPVVASHDDRLPPARERFSPRHRPAAHAQGGGDGDPGSQRGRLVAADGGG